ncbi:hypothetical protein VNO77_20028 [Canavalia gladiata]|uniref:Uncharacterized protein n=1 Tax=Canavalia gladiata TaxID=3824 RepID=A0AAN9QM12_CANGL
MPRDLVAFKIAVWTLPYFRTRNLSLSTTNRMRPLKIGLVFGLGAMFGILMSRGAQRSHCHKAAGEGHHRWGCHTQARKKEIAEASSQDEPSLANN